MSEGADMNDLTIFPAHLNALSVGQLAGLAHSQLHEVNTNLDQLIDWAKKARLKVDAALEQRYGERTRKNLTESGRDFGTAHVIDGPLRVTLDLPKRVSWDQKQLGARVGRHESTCITIQGEGHPPSKRSSCPFEVRPSQAKLDRISGKPTIPILAIRAYSAHQGNGASGGGGAESGGRLL